MSTLAVNTITNAAGGDTAQINGMTPTGDSLQGFRNRIINGDMRIAQRGTAAVTANDSYPVDRMNIGNSTDGAFSAIQDSDVPVGFNNSVKFTITTADASVTGTQGLFLVQPIEGFNTADLNWGTANAKTVTLSFLVRSSVTGTFSGSLVNNAQDRSYPFTYTISVADTWEYKTVEIEGDTSGTWLTNNNTGIRLYFSLGTGATRLGTAGVWGGARYQGATGETALVNTLNATWFVTGVQLEAGAVATPFERRPFGAELALCQRYCPAYPTTTAVTPNEELPIAGSGINSTVVYGLFEFPVPTRVPVTGVTVSSASHFTTSRPSTGNIVATAIAFRSGGSQSASINITIASGGVADVPYFVFANNASARIVFNGAEL